MATVEQYRVPAAATADGRGSGEDSRFLRRRLLWWWVDCGRRTPLQLCGKDQFGNGAEKCGRFCVGNRKRFYGERNGFLSFLVFLHVLATRKLRDHIALAFEFFFFLVQTPEEASLGKLGTTQVENPSAKIICNRTHVRVLIIDKDTFFIYLGSIWMHHNV